MVEEVKVTETAAKQLTEEELRRELDRIQAEADRGSKNHAGKIILIVVLVIAMITLGAFGVMALREVLGKDKHKTGQTTNTTTVQTQSEKPEEEETPDKTNDMKEDSKNTGDSTITTGGEYVLSEKINSAVMIDSLEDVVLKLKGATITSNNGPAIISVGKGSLTIEVVEGTENILQCSGKSEYAGCIYARGPLTMSGNGQLTIREQ